MSMNWADLGDNDTVEDAKKAVMNPTPAAAPTPATESGAEEDGDAETVLAKEALKNMNLAIVDPESQIDDTVAKNESLNDGRIVVKNTATGQAPIYESKKSFEEMNLKPELLSAVYEIGFKAPSMIQAVALPLIAQGGNIIAQAHHGSGKTATFVLAMLSKIDVNQRTPQAICLCTTRELAVQILSVIQALGKNLGSTAFLAVKDVRRRTVFEHIVVGTPGTVRGFMKNNLIPNSHLNIKMVVYDEADVLIDEASVPSGGPGGARGGRGGSRGGRGGRGGAAAGGRGESMVTQAAEVKRACSRAQTLLFSATFSDSVMEFAKHIAPNAVMITVEKEKLALDNIVQLTMDCKDEDDKYDQLATIYENIDTKQSIIFCNTVKNTQSLCKKLQADDYNVSVIYGALSPEQRDMAVKDFRDGKTKVLISTNVLARGLDVPAVSLVINYDLPVTSRNGGPHVYDPETYMHRIGRSGRFGRKACAINLTHDGNSRAVIESIEKEYSHKTLRVPRDDVDVLEEIVKAAYVGKVLRPEDVKTE